eukprot:TRINITY_DN9640_c0_g3_i2.p1 TRINITY_DN9640_c0_g3~~TRINITY_DN9640_c0_g3_i2.p1  ORF type:complete len:379 (-),score=86.15 TRINITY_DN9640_c0_g3_i2:393-1529(-)
MGAAFMAKWAVTPGFNYDKYLMEAYASYFGILITLDWVPWLMMAPIAGGGLILSSSFDLSVYNYEAKLWCYCLLNSAVLALMIAYSVWAFRARRALALHIRTKCPEVTVAITGLLKSVETSSGQHPRIVGDFATKLMECARPLTQELPPAPTAWRKEIECRAIQSFSLFFAMSGALYFCHFMKGIQTVYHASKVWHAFCILPIAIGLVLLPVTLKNLVRIHAVLTPDPEVMDRVLREMRSYKEDCTLIQEQLSAAVKEGCFDKMKSNEMLANLGNIMHLSKGGGEKELQKKLQEMHVHVSLASLRRLKSTIPTMDSHLTPQGIFKAMQEAGSSSMTAADTLRKGVTERFSCAVNGGGDAKPTQKNGVAPQEEQEVMEV